MNKRWASTLLVLMMVLIFTTTTAHAQLSGHNSRGDYGLLSGTLESDKPLSSSVVETAGFTKQRVSWEKNELMSATRGRLR